MSDHSPVSPTLVTQAHRIAADRIMRVCRDQGTVEALTLFAELLTREQGPVAVLLARVAVGRAEPVPPPDDSPTWTEEEARRCHALFANGYRSPWVEAGNRIYKRRNKRLNRAARGMQPSGPGLRGRPRLAG